MLCIRKVVSLASVQRPERSAVQPAAATALDAREHSRARGSHQQCAVGEIRRTGIDLMI